MSSKGWPKGKKRGPHSEEHRRKICESMEGKIFSLKHRENISAARKGKKFSPLSAEHRRNIGDAMRGEKNWNWGGGRSYGGGGTIVIWCPEHPRANKRGRVYEHRLVMEEILGRFLTAKEVVHHINGIRDDNRKENLMLFSTNGDHLKYHREV